VSVLCTISQVQADWPLRCILSLSRAVASSRPEAGVSRETLRSGRDTRGCTLWTKPVDNSFRAPGGGIMAVMPYMYIVECSDGSYYVGSTWVLERRVWEHNNGGGAEYTRRRRPVRLVYYEEYERVTDAYGREKQVQNWSRAKRRALIDGRLGDLPLLSRSPADMDE